MKILNWEFQPDQLKTKVREAATALPRFFKNPVEGMRNLPDWEWPETLILHAIFASCCAVLSNLIERNYLGIITGIVIAPIVCLLLSFILAGLFYYTFFFWFDRELPLRKLYIHIVYASIPTLIVSTVAFMLPPLMLVGAAASCALLYVGFVENFQIPPKQLRHFLIGLMALYAIYWLVTLIMYSTQTKSVRQRATPESLDILERELKSTD